MDHDICHSSSKGRIFFPSCLPREYVSSIDGCIKKSLKNPKIPANKKTKQQISCSKIHTQGIPHPSHPQQQKNPGGFTEKDFDSPSRCNAFVCEAIPHPTDPPGTAHHDGLEDSEDDGRFCREWQFGGF